MLGNVSADLSTIQFKAARIVRVIEDVDGHRLAFEVSYPIPSGGSDFPRRRLIFHRYNRYVVDEPGCAGEPTIQRVEIGEVDTHRVTIRMHTDLGLREVTCLQVFEEDI